MKQKPTKKHPKRKTTVGAWTCVRPPRQEYPNNKGITLIALVITIIVLLILAGVTLSLVIGQDGILGRAESAVNQTDIAEGREQAELLASSHVTDYYDKKYVNNDSDITKKSVADYVAEKLKDGEDSGDYNVKAKSRKIEVNKNGTTITTGTIKDDGKIEWENSTTGSGGSNFSSQITEANYGDYVDLETNYVKGNTLRSSTNETAVEDWRIFYKDSSGGVYLILADYLPRGLQPAGVGDYNSGDRWWYLGYLNDVYTSFSWNTLLSSEYVNVGITVKGGVDLPTWVESWNGKGYTKLYTNTYSNENGSSQGDGLDGYYLGVVDNPTGCDVSLASVDVGYGDSLYIIDGYGYKMASPSARDGRGLLCLLRYELER